eukprot:scaffold3908_cov200-Skeletonema_marinoi.AAC.3
MEAAASMCSHGGDHLPASNNGIAAGASSAAAAGSNFVSGDVDKDGPEPVPPSSSSSHTHFDLSQTFMSLRTLLAAAEAFAKAGGWIIKYKERAYFTPENWPHDTPFEEEAKEAKRYISKRGTLYCSPLSDGRPKEVECPFQLVYGWKQSKMMYVFQESSHISHNHVLHPLAEQNFLGGKFFVTYEQQLSPEEEAYIEEQVMCKIDIPNMQENLERRFPGRCFDHVLLHRFKKKVLDNWYGTDRADLLKLMQKGDLINANDGLFVPDPNPEDFSIDAIHCQTKIQRLYAEHYGDFILGDGTHGMSKHKGVVVIYVVTDCLLKSKIVGWTSCFTENSAPIVRGVKLFFPTKGDDPRTQIRVEVCELGDEFFDPLQDIAATVAADNDNPDGDESANGDAIEVESTPTVTFMSDEGSAFSILAEVMGWYHLLDRHHFTEQISEGWVGLPDPDEFYNSIIDILNEPHQDTLTTLLSEAKEMYTTIAATKLLQKIDDLKEQLCYAYTCKFFTAAHTSSQRVEGINASLKGRGKLKKRFSGATYAEMVSRISHKERVWNRDALKELERCIQNGMMTGERVVKEITANALLALNISSVDATDIPTIFTVKESENSTRFSTVNTNAEVTFNGIVFDGIMVCDCSMYSSSKLICPCICRVCQHMNVDFKNPKHIHPRYWIVFHPLYVQALKNLDMSDNKHAPWVGKYEPPIEEEGATAGQNTLKTGENGIVKLRTSIFHELGDFDNHSPAKRVTLLRDLFTDLLSVASSTGQKTKLAAASIVELTNRLGAARLGDEPVCVRATAFDNCRVRYANDMLPQSQLKRHRNGVNRTVRRGQRPLSKQGGKKKTIRHCRLCRSKGHPASVSAGHRSNSSKCPSRTVPTAQVQQLDNDGDDIDANDDEEDFDGGEYSSANDSGYDSEDDSDANSEEDVNDDNDGEDVDGGEDEEDNEDEDDTNGGDDDNGDDDI